MELSILVLIVFILSCLLSIFLVAKKPYFYFNLGKKRLKIESYFFGVLAGAIFLIAIKLLTWKETIVGLGGTAGLSPLGILILFLSMVFISIFLDQTGFFEYCANIALKYSKGDTKKLFFAVYITVFILTIFTSNDDDIIIFTPFIYYIAKNAKINPIPYLFAEFFAANTSSMMLYTGNPTNIIIAGALGLDFSQYTYYMFLPTIIAGLVNLLLLYFVFRKEINKKIGFSSDINLSNIIKDKTGTVFGLIVLIGCIIMLSLAPKINVEMWQIAFISALLLALIIFMRKIFFKIKNTNRDTESPKFGKIISRIPWSIVPFALSLFLMVHALNLYGITSQIGTFFGQISSGSAFLTAIIYGFGSAVSANFINNIPMTISFVPIISHAGEHTFVAALATTIGSNLGANITPFGALAGIMWLSILKTKGIKIRIVDFIKWGAPITFFALSASLVVLGLEFVLL